MDVSRMDVKKVLKIYYNNGELLAKVTVEGNDSNAESVYNYIAHEYMQAYRVERGEEYA